MKKSVLKATEILGLIIDTSQMNISLTEENLQKVIKHCQEMYENLYTTVLKLAKFIDLLLSIVQMVLPARV